MVTMSRPDAICLEGGLALIRDGVHIGAIGVSGIKSFKDGIATARGAAELGS